MERDECRHSVGSKRPGVNHVRFLVRRRNALNQFGTVTDKHDFRLAVVHADSPPFPIGVGRSKFPLARAEHLLKMVEINLGRRRRAQGCWTF